MNLLESPLAMAVTVAATVTATVTVPLCLCCFGRSSVWWPLRDGAGFTAQDQGFWGVFPGVLSRTLSWYRGSLQFLRQSDFVVSSEYLPDPVFTRDFQVGTLPRTLSAPCVVAAVQRHLAPSREGVTVAVSCARALTHGPLTHHRSLGSRILMARV
jgi:hypothetical protein